MRARRKRVTVTFAALMGLLIVCFITTIYVTNHKTEKAIEEMLLSQASESVKMRSDILSNLFYTSRNILANCIYDAELNAILKNTVAYDRRAAKTVGEKLRNFSLYHLNDLNMRVTIFDLNGNTYTNWQRGGDFYDEIMSTRQVREAIGAKGSFFFLSHPYWYADTDLCDERIDVLTLGNVIVDQHLSKPIGILLVSVEEASLLSALESEGVQVAVKEKDASSPLCGSMSPELLHGIENVVRIYPDNHLERLQWAGKNLVVCRSAQFGSTAELYQAMDFDMIFDSLIGIRKFNNLMLLLCLCILAAVIVLMGTQLLLPLRELYRQVRRLEISKGNIPMITTGGYRECQEMADAINGMSRRTMEMFNAVQKEQRDKAELRYQYLLSQLNPHFLLNTLNNIKWVAYMSKAEQVAKMITSLGFLLETSLGKKTAPPTIGRELEYIRNYMYLQQMHYGDTISCEVDADETLLDCRCERFCLQTSVENAIRHGWSKERPLHIRISVGCNERQIVMRVRDDGKGILPSRLADLQATLRAASSLTPSGHIGLLNICQRLQYRYGEKYSLSIDSCPMEWTEVCICIPVTEIEKEAYRHV